MVIISSYAQGMAVRSQAGMRRRPPRSSHFGLTEREGRRGHLRPPRSTPSCQALARPSKGEGPGPSCAISGKVPSARRAALVTVVVGKGSGILLPQTPFSAEVLSF